MSYQAPIDESQLIADLQNPLKASEAFDAMMCRYGEKIYWQIRKMVVDHEDASDLLQNVFLKAWNSLKSFRGDAKISTWLYKIAVNESINFINKEKQKAMMAPQEGDEFLLANVEADTWFDGDEAKVMLLKAVANLPEKQRLVFNMRYFDEMKYEDISEVLGTSVGALKASYHHAVKKIEESLR
jgi:RNA polymerase sigma-70 factor (ECF subfamily)